MPGELAIIGHQHLVGAAFIDSGRVWYVLFPFILLIGVLYFLLFVVFPNIDQRVRRWWAICIPLALIVMVLDMHFPLDPYMFRGFDGLVEAFALMLFLAPLAVTPMFQAASRRRGGPILLLLPAILAPLLAFTIPRYFPGFWHTQVGILVLIVWFVIASALVRWQKGPRAR